MAPPFTTSDDEPILVLGGTGHYGRNVVRRLLDRRERVRVLSRNAARARSVLGERPEVIEGDITSRATVVSALDGTRAIVVAVSAFSWKIIRRRTEIERESVLRILEEADRMGIARVVCLSGYDVRKDFAERLGVLAIAKPMLDVLAALAESRLNGTVLGCSPSMEMFFAMIRGANVYLVMAIRMLNNFPEELVAQVPTDHQALLETFDFTPTTLEMEAHRRMGRAQ